MTARKVYKEDKYNCIRYNIKYENDYDRKCINEITKQIEDDHMGIYDPDCDEDFMSFKDTKMLDKIFRYFITRLRLCCGKFHRKFPIEIHYDFCYREYDEVLESRKGNQDNRYKYIFIDGYHPVYMYPDIKKKPDYDNIDLIKLNN